MGKNTKKVVKRKINIKGLLVLLLIIYLLVMVVYYVLSMPIKNIYIEGTTNITDHEIIMAAGIKDYPSLLKVSTFKMKKNIKKLDFISDVKVKRSIFGKITIKVEEAKALFFNKDKDKLVLSNGKEINSDNYDYGYPTLINYVPDKIYKKLVKSLNKTDHDILSSVSEIEYSVSRSGDKIIDDTRFILRMNDGNTVYVNLINIKNLNKYQEIYATLEDALGVIYLDSSSNENIYFKSYAAIAEEEAKKNEEQAEESEVHE